ncbi:Glycine--tRNA ligase 2, chloroplastic/mitochondrial [Glycine soja]|uniref:glycine--tRNA ligase n=1 Tax=Glycine soja TaxID=3848 RepID=A0A0B2NXJ5_GLYSO|nr:Glycine--tRNA ligase 2, chloroplastic/mitochondrial [Glycine soja]
MRFLTKQPKVKNRSKNKTSGNSSFGLLNTSSAVIQVETAKSYSISMKNVVINVSVEDRKKIIFEQSNALAESVNGQILIPKGLLDEVVNLVEAPFPVLGKFKETFLDLPKDLLTMVMQKHQKYFAVCDANGQLLPYFVAVANGAIDETTVRKGNEAVLRARYEDAKFFYEMDTCKRFSEFRKQLKNILFHEKLGTMLDKMTRVENMVTKLSCLLDINEDVQQIIRDASSLAMSDLATAVVTEFTSLSGIMGRHYALRDGYSDQIAEALLEITLPRFSGDILPKSDADIVLAIADRWKNYLKEPFPKVVEAYSWPTRIVRGKEDELHMEVDETAFVTNEESVLCGTFLSVKKSINPGTFSLTWYFS